MADRANSSDFHVSRTTDIWNVLVERQIIRNHETMVAIAGRTRNVGIANTKRGGLSVRKSGSVDFIRRSLVLLSFINISWLSFMSLWAYLHVSMGLTTPFYSVLVSVSVFMSLSTVFHSINSPDNSPLSHSVLPVLLLPSWSFHLYISLWKSPSALI